MPQSSTCHQAARSSDAPRARPRAPLRVTGLLSLATIVTACAPEPHMIPVSCRSISSANEPGSDTLSVLVHIDDGMDHRRSLLLVRVDPLSERGAVLFGPDTPGTAAAVSVALTTSAVFQGCVAEAPSGFELRASHAPRGRIWLRVSSNVPVAARLVIGGSPYEDGGDGAEVVVSPGTSARVVTVDGLPR